MVKESVTVTDKQTAEHFSANKITTSVTSFFEQMDDGVLCKFTLKTRRWVDLISIGRSYHLYISPRLNSH